MLFWEILAYLLLLVSGYVIALVVISKSYRTANQRDRLSQRCIALTKENIKLQHEIFRLTYIVPETEKNSKK